MKGKESKPHIGIFGRRNNGKSSLINALAGHDVAIVSELAGTTTDPVKKSIELAGIGPAVLIDTAGSDDFGELGQKRVEKTKAILKEVDAALLVISQNAFGDPEQHLIEEFVKWDIPYLVVHNKSDEEPLSEELKNKLRRDICEVSALKNTGIDELMLALKNVIPESAYHFDSLLGDLLTEGDAVLLIAPVDTEAPEGRLILPQVQVIRDVLDNDCVAIVVKEPEIESYLKKLTPRPVLAVTDSQVFARADAAVPKDIPLTSFSIVLARHKGDFTNYVKGTPHLGKLKDGDRLLILESCTHHVSCDDIGRFKIPRWLSNFTGKKLEFDVVSGLGKTPRDISEYAMVIQCGGCMITRRQIINRLKPAVDAGIPVTNYGMAIAWMHGIYDRAMAPFLG
jgi:[FeFe] hydrogenase H-cluster maturation GTPase HydF